MPFNVRTKNSKDDWRTPQYFFDLLDREFHFTLDAAADERNTKCDKFYTERDNGLIKDWSGETVFVNPPFSQKAEWIRKCYIEGKKPDTTVVLIIPSTTDTAAWHDYVMKADEIRFVRGRVAFEHPEKAGSSPTFPLSIVIFKEGNREYPKVSSFIHRK